MRLLVRHMPRLPPFSWALNPRGWDARAGNLRPPSASRRRPAGSSMRSTVPSPQATFRPFLSAARTRAGGFPRGLVQHGGGKDFAFHPVAALPWQQGQGMRPRTWSWSVRAGWVQSMGESSRLQHGGQRDLALRPGGCGWRCRRRCSGTVSTSRSAPRRARRSWSSLHCLVRVDGCVDLGDDVPGVQGSWAMCMMVTPVSLSPFSTAQWMGAAPRYLGSRDEWTLMQPYLGVVQASPGAECVRRRPPR